MSKKNNGISKCLCVCRGTGTKRGGKEKCFKTNAKKPMEGERKMGEEDGIENSGCEQ